MSESKRLEPIGVTDVQMNHTPEVSSIVKTLQSIILKTVPNATQKAQPHWHSLNFSHPKAGYFCGIFPFALEVKLVFEWGVLLPDPDSLLQGNAKQIRFILIQNKKEIRTKAIQKLIKAALELPHNRATKLALVQSGAKPLGRRS